MKKQRGLTLLELLVTVTIIVIVSTIGVPSFSETLKQQQLRAQINEFRTALQLTQSEAIKRGKTVVICKSDNPETTQTPECGLTSDTSINWESGWVIFVDDNTNGVINTKETIIRRGSPLRAGYTLRGGSGTTSSVSYQTTGETVGQTFVLCENNDITHARAIYVGTNGRIRLADLTSSGTPLSSDACLSS
jgi:type IV fimbrial biogenesis protein FimT